MFFLLFQISANGKPNSFIVSGFIEKSNKIFYSVKFKRGIFCSFLNLKASVYCVWKWVREKREREVTFIQLRKIIIQQTIGKEFVIWLKVFFWDLRIVCSSICKSGLLRNNLLLIKKVSEYNSTKDFKDFLKSDYRIESIVSKIGTEISQSFVIFEGGMIW